MRRGQVADGKATEAMTSNQSKESETGNDKYFGEQRGTTFDISIQVSSLR